MKWLLGILVVLMVFQVCACVDINSASKTELDEIVWVGPATADKIVNARPFGSVDDLIKVSGIGEIKLGDIKEQGLACVENVEIIEETSSPEIEEERVVERIPQSIPVQIKEEPVELEVIKIGASKDIKTENDSENLDKSDYAKYGFVLFCVLLGFLFVLKKRKVQEID